MTLAGILNVSKPAGWTSFDVVAFVRKRSGEKRVGHAGTLDPFAEGVLPVCLGQATRAVEYLMDARKVYRAVVRLGRETDTYDRTGTVVAEQGPGRIGRSDVERALEAFEGEIEQTPPPFSALKREGVPLYKLARSGVPVQAPSRRVRVDRVALTSFELPFAGIEVECGKGTYIRSIAHDLGALLGVGACLEALTRTRVGPFALDDAVDVDKLQAEFEAGSWRERLLPVDYVLLDMPAAILCEESSRRVCNGVSAAVLELREPPSALARAYSCSGDFLAVLRREAPGRWRPAKVFSAN